MERVVAYVDDEVQLLVGEAIVLRLNYAILCLKIRYPFDFFMDYYGT